MKFRLWLEQNFVEDNVYKAQDIQRSVAPGDLQSVAEWMGVPLENLNFVYRLIPISLFAKQAEDMSGTYDEFPKDRRRTNKILKLIKSQPLYPVFIEEGDVNNFIMEGRHRIVAFWQSGVQKVPVFYVRKV